VHIHVRREQWAKVAVEAKAVEAREEERVEIPIGRVGPGAPQVGTEVTIHRQRSNINSSSIGVTYETKCPKPLLGYG